MWIGFYFQVVEFYSKLQSFDPYLDAVSPLHVNYFRFFFKGNNPIISNAAPIRPLYVLFYPFSIPRYTRTYEMGKWKLSYILSFWEMIGVEEILDLCWSLSNRLHPNPSYRRLMGTGIRVSLSNYKDVITQTHSRTTSDIHLCFQILSLYLFSLKSYSNQKEMNQSRITTEPFFTPMKIISNHQLHSFANLPSLIYCAFEQQLTFQVFHVHCSNFLLIFTFKHYPLAKCKQRVHAKTGHQI